MKPKCPKCESEKITVGFGPLRINLPPRDLGMCQECNYLGTWEDFDNSLRPTNITEEKE